MGQLATILTADRLSSASRALIEAAYTANWNPADPQAGMKAAQALMITTPEFHGTTKVDAGSNTRSPTPPRGTKTDTDGYKAVVHIYLFGGMDSMNLLTPHPVGCPGLYNEYTHKRGNENSLNLSDMANITIDESASDQPDQPCSAFGVNSAISSLADIYNAGEGLFVANAGHLQKPVNKNNFFTETTTQLFSHHTMREEGFDVDAFNNRDNTGVLGRMNDVLGNKMATGQTSIDKILGILVGK